MPNDNDYQDEQLIYDALDAKIDKDTFRWVMSGLASIMVVAVLAGIGFLWALYIKVENNNGDIRGDIGKLGVQVSELKDEVGDLKSAFDQKNILDQRRNLDVAKQLGGVDQFIKETTQARNSLRDAASDMKEVARDVKRYLKK